jgi:hypothetical protein
MVVVEELPGHARHRAELGCDRELVRSKGRWLIQKMV